MGGVGDDRLGVDRDGRSAGFLATTFRTRHLIIATFTASFRTRHETMA
jgi:hypothetical protein